MQGLDVQSILEERAIKEQHIASEQLAEAMAEVVFELPLEVEVAALATLVPHEHDLSIAMALVVFPVAHIGLVAHLGLQILRHRLLAHAAAPVLQPVAGVGDAVRGYVFALSASFAIRPFAVVGGQLLGLFPPRRRPSSLGIEREIPLGELPLAMGPSLLELAHVLTSIGEPGDALLAMLRIAVPDLVGCCCQVRHRGTCLLHEALCDLRQVEEALKASVRGGLSRQRCSSPIDLDVCKSRAGIRFGGGLL
mmetsp:Transcript_92330/g.197851  ORF Transcript_92330/g.197851 Transcript_92330/m.197851 type:complete len:251 (-) Transcript_92330:83-835(-)